MGSEFGVKRRPEDDIDASTVSLPHPLTHNSMCKKEVHHGYQFSYR